ncbi:MAG: hypothetical protein ACN4GM_08545 [Gammaproteobacteria bacterium]
MGPELLDSLSIIFVYVGTIVFILIAFEIGYQSGKYARSYYQTKDDTTHGGIMGGVLAMMAFVLALTFSMTASRFEHRKQTLLDEVNAIYTAYLRADLLAQPQQTEVKRLLREYVDMRLAGIEKAKRDKAINRSLELQQLLWNQVVSAAKENPSKLSILPVQSINDIIDIHEKRIAAVLHERIPRNIWLTLYAITAFSMVTMGSQGGLAKTRRLIQVIPAVLAFSALITLIVDLDRPAELGLIKVSQQAMFDLQSNLQHDAN